MFTNKNDLELIFLVIDIIRAYCCVLPYCLASFIFLFEFIYVLYSQLLEMLSVYIFVETFLEQRFPRVARSLVSLSVVSQFTLSQCNLLIIMANRERFALFKNKIDNLSVYLQKKSYPEASSESERGNIRKLCIFFMHIIQQGKEMDKDELG